MAREGWTLTWQYGTPDAPKLNFRKGFDECVVEVEKGLGDTMTSGALTRVRITLSPGRG